MQRELAMMSVCDNGADRTGAIMRGDAGVSKQLYILRRTANIAYSLCIQYGTYTQTVSRSRDVATLERMLLRVV